MQISITLDPSSDSDVQDLIALTKILAAQPASDPAPTPTKKAAAPKAKAEVEAEEPEADTTDEAALTVAIDEAVAEATALLKNTKIANRRDIVEDALKKVGAESVSKMRTLEQVETFRAALS